MRETGTVKSVEGDFCQVVVTRQSACGENCASCKGGCKLQNQICNAKNSVGAKAGDKVIIEMDTKKVLKSALLVYILPIIVFFTVYFLLYNLLESTRILGAILAMVTVFVLLFFHDRRHKSDFISQVVKILEK